MNDPVWVKHYEDPARCRAARNHLRWLAGLRSGVQLPALHDAGPRHLVFEHLGSQQPGPEHLALVADTLGRLHATAYTRELHRARLDQPFQTGELIITDFISPRHKALRQVDLHLDGLPAAIYKDANLRNFLLTDIGVAIVDFDHLTLAPFGYDLAKLIVTTAMTHGPLDEATVRSALGAYNHHAAGTGPGIACPMDRLLVFAEIHHILTTRYLGQHGYRYAWPDVAPTVTRTP